MPLVLTLHRSRDPANRQRESRTLDEGSLSIGRGTGNSWILQDPAQHLSKVHCIVAAGPGDTFVLTDCSSNGVFLNGSPERMPRDSRAPIADGDEFTLGDYLIQVRVVPHLSSRTVADSAAAAPRGAPPTLGQEDPFGLDEFLAPAPPPPPPPSRAAPPPAPRFDPFADPSRERRDDPFGDDADDLLGAPAPARRPFGDPAPPAPSRARPDPFDTAASADPFARPTGAAPPPPGRADPFADDDLFRGIKPAVDWQGPSQPDNIDAVSHAFVPPKPMPTPNMDEWDDLLGDTPPGMPFTPAPPPQAAPPAPAPPIPQPPPAPPQAAPFPAAPPAAAPHPVAATPPAPLVAAPPSAAPSGPDAARLLAAFLEGAGVPKLDVSAHDPEAYFRDIGALFATMIESIRDVLMSRATVKGEFGVEQTMLRARDNNALKFSVTPADAVAALLQPGRPGYMEPMRATREAFDDVRIHQLAVMAGVQAALLNLLRSFDPAALEARLEGGSKLGNLLPGAHRAKLWEAFCAAYRDIARDADSDFQAVFGREFAKAYTEQARSR